MQSETISLRSATPADTEALATLIVQLYDAEAPGVLRGPRPRQLQLFRYVVEHEIASGMRGRYLAVEGGGAVVGSASLRLPSQTTGGVLPPGIFGMSLRALGIANSLRMFSSLLRAALVPDTPLRSSEAYIYSVVVDEQVRGRGIGSRMMELVEHEAHRNGARAALLRVVVGNQAARRLYKRLGYQIVSRSPAMLDRLSFPTELMRKELQPIPY